MSKKLVSTLLASAMIASVLTGCAQTASSEANTDVATVAKTEPTEETAEASGDEDHEIVIWCWDSSDSRAQMHEEFTEDTGIKVTLEMVDKKDMAQKIQTTIASGGELPSICWCEATYRGTLLNLGCWEDIISAGFKADQMLPYVIPLDSDVNGNYIGPECPSVGGIAYKRDLALKYLGTDDPEEIQKMFTSWDDFITYGRQVQEESDGKVFMFSSLGDAGIMLKGQGANPFVTGNEITFEESMKPLMSTLIDFAANGVCDVLEYDSAEDGASYTDDNHIFYPCANWSIVFTIQANDPEKAHDWGFFVAPDGGFIMGGTTMCVPKGGKNLEDTITYLNYFWADERGAKLQRQYKGNFSPLKTLYESEEIFYSKEEEWFQGQDVLSIIQTQILPDITEARVPTIYDTAITNAYTLAYKKINASRGNITVDEILDYMAENMMENEPDLTRAN